MSGFFQKIREKRCLFQRFVTSIVATGYRARKSKKALREAEEGEGEGEKILLKSTIKLREIDRE